MLGIQLGHQKWYQSTSSITSMPTNQSLVNLHSGSLLGRLHLWHYSLTNTPSDSDFIRSINAFKFVAQIARLIWPPISKRHKSSAFICITYVKVVVPNLSVKDKKLQFWIQSKPLLQSFIILTFIIISWGQTCKLDCPFESFHSFSNSFQCSDIQPTHSRFRQCVYFTTKRSLV